MIVREAGMIGPAAAHGFCLFGTAIGRCGIAWTERGVARVQLPEGSDRAIRARMLGSLPDAREAPPPPDVRRALEAIAALLRGDPSDLDAVALDMDGVPPFHRRVYEVARAIRPGSTLSYGDVAARLDAPGAARAVGQALGRNPFAIVVPCHRVLAARGRSGGFSARGGIATKLRLLAIEGVRRADQPGLFEDGGAPGVEDEGALGVDDDAAPGFDARAAVEHLRQADPALGRVIDLVGPCRLALKTTPSVFVALAEAIVYQQLTGTAAATIFARVCALFPRGHTGPTAAQILRTSDAQLRGAGLSRAKVLALRDLAQRARKGEIPTLAEARSMADEAVVDRLTTVRGIGRWTVEMLLIFRLGRPDVLPADDYGIRKGFARAFGKRSLPSGSDVEARGARWSPYRTVASWYLWRAAERAGA
jgi:methylated-DNA-[protein]-cysteine S-methyltransferase